MIKIFDKHKFFPWILLFGLIIWPLLLPGYFSHHDDLQVMRIVEMRKCLVDLQIPCRWVPDMGYGNGYPLFNYYSGLPYYIGALISFLLGYIAAAKVLFALPIFLGAFSMYLLAKELFGKSTAFLAAVFFSFAPYRALDIYVRGAVAESFAMAIIPLSFYFSLKLIQQRNTAYLIGLALSLAAFLISHNIMTLLFFPVFLIFTIFFLAKEKGKNISLIIWGIILGVGLSSFFIFPAYFEKNLVQIDNLIRLDLNFRAHFVNLNQLFFSRFWDYGASSPGTNDTISFQVGWPHWWIAGVSFIIVIINVFRKRRFVDFLAFGLTFIFIFSIFMTHIKSAFIWEQLEILKFTQFPWRFLALTVFSGSLLGAYFIYSVKEEYKKVTTSVLIILVIILNWGYFRPEKFYFGLNDQEKLSGDLWKEQQKAAILDYLPQTAIEPKEAASNIVQVVSGKATIENFENKSNRWQFRAKVEKGNTTVEVPVFDFPKWEVRVNSQKVNHSNKNYLGRININFDKEGEYKVTGKFKNTAIRVVSNLISAVSLIYLLWIVYGKRKKIYS